MIQVVVLWEDQRDALQAQFGPHELLLACVADDLKRGRYELKNCIVSLPKKGNGNVVKELRLRLPKLARSGPVLAVIDRDRAHDLLSPELQTMRCFSGVCSGIHGIAPGGYELILLDQNIETLYRCTRKLLSMDAGPKKPTPEERDTILNKIAFGGEATDASLRTQLREAIPSFNRLVEKVLAVLPETLG